MKKRNLPSFSIRDGKRVFEFSAPSSWEQLQGDELRYILSVLTLYQEQTVAKCDILFRLCGIEVIKHTRTGWKCSVPCQAENGKKKREVLYLSEGEILSLLKNFDFIEDYTNYKPLDWCAKLYAVDRLIKNVTFLDYLQLEKNYQLYLIHKDDKFLQKMGWILYRDEAGKSDKTAIFLPFELLNVFMWYSSIKGYLAENFPHFFKPSKVGGELKQEDLMPAMQAQIRALTDGDITKQQAVYDSLCWDALSELDNKAREAEEFKARNSK